jgi:hypothetical protein
MLNRSKVARGRARAGGVAIGGKACRAINNKTAKKRHVDLGAIRRKAGRILLARPEVLFLPAEPRIKAATGSVRASPEDSSVEPGRAKPCRNADSEVFMLTPLVDASLCASPITTPRD